MDFGLRVSNDIALMEAEVLIGMNVSYGLELGWGDV